MRGVLRLGVAVAVATTGVRADRPMIGGRAVARRRGTAGDGDKRLSAAITVALAAGTPRRVGVGDRDRVAA